MESFARGVEDQRELKVACLTNREAVAPSAATLPQATLGNEE